jgi:RNA polymerase sigma-70 factor, ECF subfamily
MQDGSLRVQFLPVQAAEASDEQVIDRISRGDREAVRVLYRRYGRLVYGLAVQVVGDGPSAEEVAQDVFLKVWEKAGTFSAEKAKVSTWLMRITRNRAIDAARRAARPDRRPAQVWDETVPAAPDPASPDPARLQLRDECDEDLHAALAALPGEQRRALDLAFFRGLTHAQIAQSLAAPLGTVKTRIRDAMRKLREAIDEECAP